AAAAAAAGHAHHHSHPSHPPPFVHLGANAGAAPAPRSYAELVEIAEHQRRQIEANRKEEERRHGLMASRGHSIPRGDLPAHVKSLRREVAEGELEMKRLNELERETRTLRVRNDEASRQVEMLTRTAEEEQALLRKAAAKVDSLRSQLEELHRRRRAAANAALQEQKRMQTAQTHAAQMAAVRSASSATPTPDIAQRPRASVEPFQIQQMKSPEDTVTTSPKKEYGGEDETDQRLRHPPAPTELRSSGGQGKIRVVDQQVTSTTDVHQRLTMTTSSSSVVSQTREDVSPSPPKDPHPTPSTIPGEPGAIAPGPHEPQEPAELAHARLRGGRTDLVSLRADSLKATKRRSWAASESSMSELDTIRRVLLEQQLKGRNHYIPDLSPVSPAPSSVGGVSTIEEENKVEEEEEEEKTEDSPFAASSSSSMGTTDSAAFTVSAAPSSAAATAGSVASTSGVERPTALGGVQKETTTEEPGSSSAEEAGSLCSTRSSEEAPIEMEVPKPSKAVKGILRQKGRPSSGRRIEFDPLALLLDAALEGEIDLVKESAKKLSDVSASNDEGITALHNAICAGHYEIVRFLIESNADVNAQDSDGWTPLHCAASCNNLPMVRVLVEGGACVLSSTLSDLETPVQKCEEEEDGYDTCLRYLIAAHNATGSANGGLVYAAYPYAAEYEDEMVFEGGDRLRVLQKDAPDTDNGWWLCEKQREDGSTEQGLAPRTYLALYPPIKYRQRGFVPFDLSLESNNNEKDQQK
ncbi:hypothetical protein PFISCL1PPCAC_752, partial [Pristionchus fissidentatus]